MLSAECCEFGLGGVLSHTSPSPLAGEGREKGEQAWPLPRTRCYGRALPPSPQPSPARGEGARIHPLPRGERGPDFTLSLCGRGQTIIHPLPLRQSTSHPAPRTPHPALSTQHFHPLPLRESTDALFHPLPLRESTHALFHPLPLRERGSDRAGLCRDRGVWSSPAPPLPNPLLARGEGAQISPSPAREFSPNWSYGWRGKVTSRRLGRFGILPDAF